MDYLVMLLIDNFFVYKLGLTLIKKGEGLYYIKIIFLPPNTISVCQPLNQDIIYIWKIYYRKS